MEANKAKRYLLISPQAWGKMFVSKHHYAIALAANANNVYFLQPPVRSNSIFSKIEVKAIIEYEGICLITYHIPSFIYKLRFHFRPIYDLYISSVIFPKLNKLGFFDEIWCFETNAYSSLKGLHSRRKLLFVVDQPTGENSLNLTSSVDAIASISDIILESYQNEGKESILLNHGLGEMFAEVSSKKILGNGYIKGSPIKVGYIGNLLIGEVLDRIILKKIIENSSEIEFHFWGTYEVNNSNIGVSMLPEVEQFIMFLKSRTNVKLHGAIEPNKLVFEMQNVDAFLIAYAANKDVNRGSNSHKIIECLSTGKVVISSHISTYLKFPGILQMVDEQSNERLPLLFKQVIGNLEEFNRADNANLRIQFSLDNTYKRNITKIENFLKNVIESKEEN